MVSLIAQSKCAVGVLNMMGVFHLIEKNMNGNPSYRNRSYHLDFSFIVSYNSLKLKSCISFLVSQVFKLVSKG